jgi:uncharacterized protein YecE (DUF72 family)
MHISSQLNNSSHNDPGGLQRLVLDDWVGAFYHVELANKKGEWFDYYAQYFSTVEINSTFYRPPGLWTLAITAARWRGAD